MTEFVTANTHRILLLAKHGRRMVNDNMITEPKMKVANWKINKRELASLYGELTYKKNQLTL